MSALLIFRLHSCTHSTLCTGHRQAPSVCPETWTQSREQAALPFNKPSDMLKDPVKVNIHLNSKAQQLIYTSLHLDHTGLDS